MSRVETHGASIYYEVTGEGPAIVFAHGAGGNAASWWQQVPEFSKNHKVITFDHRLFGRSTCSPDDFQPRLFGEDLIAILDAEGIQQCALVCQSMGGWTGMRMALDHPDRVSCVVYSHTTATIMSEASQKLAAELADERSSLPLETRAVAYDYPDKNPNGNYLYNRISSFNVNMDRSLLVRMRETDVVTSPEQLQSYTVPTLFITGDKDAIFPPQIIELVASYVPGAQVQNLGNTGHSSYFEIPERFNKAVGAFLALHPPTGA